MNISGTVKSRYDKDSHFMAEVSSLEYIANSCSRQESDLGSWNKYDSAGTYENIHANGNPVFI